MKIFVSIEDVADCIHCQGQPKYRLVEINLTEEQEKKLRRRKHESYSQCYVQTDK